MRQNSFTTIKSIVLLAGAFTFAFLVGESVHEAGHYISHLGYGNLDVRIHLDPFGGSQIMGATSLQRVSGGVTSAAGPLLNLILGIAISLLFWRIRRPALLPVLLWGSVAMVQEGVTFSIGLLTPGGDGQWIAGLGIPSIIILMVGILLLLSGVRVTAVLFSLAGIKSDESFGKKFLIAWIGMSSLMLIRAVHAFLASPESIVENMVPLLFTVLLAALAVAQYKPAVQAAAYSQSLHTPVRWPAVGLALILGMGMFLIQVGMVS